MDKKRTLIPLLAALAALLPLHAANTAATGDSTRTSTLWVQKGLGAGYTMFRDLGTGPIAFDGAALQSYAALHMVRPQWSFGLLLRTELGALGYGSAEEMSLDALQLNTKLRIRAMRKISMSRGNLLFGASLTSYLNVTENSNYENASAGISLFAGPDIVARYEFSVPRLIKTKKRKANPRPHHLHAEMSLSPFAAVYRPGYAYIGNYTATQPVSKALFDGFSMRVKPFSAIETNVGIDYPIGDNRLSINYIWNYHSSGKNDTWRFDNASHIVECVLTLKLKSRKL